jgi:hypothetical protein
MFPKPTNAVRVEVNLNGHAATAFRVPASSICGREYRRKAKPNRGLTSGRACGEGQFATCEWQKTPNRTSWKQHLVKV